MKVDRVASKELTESKADASSATEDDSNDYLSGDDDTEPIKPSKSDTKKRTMSHT